MKKTEQLHQIKPSRRRVLGGIGAGLLAAPFVLSSRSALAAEPLVLVTWGGSFTDLTQRVIVDPFTEETGIGVTLVAGPERPLADGFTILKCYPLATQQKGGTLRHVQRRALDLDEFKRSLERIRTLRKVVGPDISLMFDLSGGLNNDQLIRFMDVCGELDVSWVEEPLDPFNLQGLRNLAGRWSIPLAAGERVYTRQGFRNLLDTGAIDIAMPDVGNCGGIFEAVQIAAMAESYNARISPHNCASSFCTAATIQVWAASAAGMPLETYPYFSDANDYVQVLKNPPEKEVRNGMLAIPTSPGIGAEIDVDAIEPFRCFDYREEVA